MTQAAPTQQQIAGFRRMFDALFDFIRWTYGVAIAGHDRMVLEKRILGGWGHPDGSLPELTAYIGGLHTTVFNEPPHRRDRYRPQVRKIFAGMFAAADPTERGEVVALLHRTLEQALPGCTGIAPRPARSGGPQPALGTVPLGGPPAWYYGGAASPTPLTHGAATGSGMGAYGYAGGALGAGSPQGAPEDNPELLDMMRLRDETARQQALMIDQNIWKMRSDLASKVIDSMSR